MIIKRFLNRFKRFLTYCENPDYFLLRKRGIYLPLYEEINQKWIRDIGFKTVLDVGANIGQFTRIARMLFPNANIYCFEPLPECVAMLQKRWSNDLMINIYDFAISDIEGESSFYRSSFSQASSLIADYGALKNHKKWIKSDSNLTIKTKSLDRLVNEGLSVQRPCLAKIDVEGAADKVIRGALSIINKIDLIIVELEYFPLWQGQKIFRDVYHMLINSNFIFVGVLGQTFHDLNGFPVQCNALFVSHEIYENLKN